MFIIIINSWNDYLKLTQLTFFNNNIPSYLLPLRLHQIDVSIVPSSRGLLHLRCGGHPPKGNLPTVLAHPHQSLRAAQQCSHGASYKADGAEHSKLVVAKWLPGCMNSNSNSNRCREREIKGNKRKGKEGGGQR